MFFQPSAFLLLSFWSCIFAAHDHNYNLRSRCRLGTFGVDYVGNMSQTVTGLECQRWDIQTPHFHTFTDIRKFPDTSMEQLGNKCRNPDLEPGGPWCYTTDPETRWQHCDVPQCSGFPECRQTRAGAEYRGQVQHTSTGLPCVAWDALSQRQLYTLTRKHISLQDTEENYCRNPDPDGHPDGVWCFTGDLPDDWEYCKVPRCKVSSQCKQDVEGLKYSGTVSVTKSGRPCQRWDQQYPHIHFYTDPTYFPEDTLQDVHNFCRNPDGNENGPWCFTQDTQVQWETCDVPVCEDCKVTPSGREYSGGMNVTSFLLPCEWWDAEPANENSDPDLFPDASLEDASNFCRNPDDKPDGPWCYTDRAADQWEYCHVPMCQGTNCDGKEKQPPIRHVLHFAIDGLHPCFTNSTLGAPNILQRMGELGSWTLTQARTVLQSWSAPSWSATVTGMDTESTGIIFNTWKPPYMGYTRQITPVTGLDFAMPSVFSTLKAQDINIRTAAFYDWNWWSYMLNSGLPGSVDLDMYCDKRTNGGIAACDAYIAANASQYLQQVVQSAYSSYTLVYMDQVDEAGHTHGWCSDLYMDAVDSVDILVGQVLDVLDELDMAEEFLVFLGSDHGGRNKNHGCFRDDCLLIPIYVRGPGVKVNYEFQHAVKNQDIVPTAVWAMGLKANPWWNGKVMTEIFEG